MQLQAKALLSRLRERLVEQRSSLTAAPGLALIWVGNDPQTATFVRVKQRTAKQLGCQFFLHHFDAIDQRQLTAVIASLNRRSDVHGIVVQLPLPKSIDTDSIIDTIAPKKDIDGLRPGSAYAAPTALGIVTLLQENSVNLRLLKTAIIGAGRLVGGPLAKIFTAQGWSFLQIDRKAEERSADIRQADVIIAATGIKHLLLPEMVHDKSIVVDGSGIDVDLEKIEPLVAKITPARGAVGPLTVHYLFENLLRAAAD